MPWMFAGGTAPTVTYTPPEEPPVDGGAYDCGDCGAQEMHPGDVAPVGCDQAGGWMRKRAQEDADWAPLRALTDGELHDIIGDCQMTSHDEGPPVWFVTAEDLRASRERTTKTFGTTARMGWATYGDDE